MPIDDKQQMFACKTFSEHKNMKTISNVFELRQIMYDLSCYHMMKMNADPFNK